MEIQDTMTPDQRRDFLDALGLRGDDAQHQGLHAVNGGRQQAEQIAARHGVDPEALLRSGHSDEAGLESYAVSLADRGSAPIPGQEKSPDTDLPHDPSREFVRDMFNTHP